MKLVIQGKNIEVTDAIREYVQQKIEKAVNHFQSLTNEVDVHLSVARNPRINPRQSAEVTIYVNGAVVRAEESSENLYASIDLVANKITRQLRKYKEKRQGKSHLPVKPNDALVARTDEVGTDVSELLHSRSPQLPDEVVRAKYFAMPPMTVEAALEQLELVDHDFYMFHNIETNEINVIYERNHGGYGLLQPRRENGHSDNHHNGHYPASASKAARVGAH
ncbi:ribosome hibernation-promoting factor, HPF/YfiA family [Almyronema epifaneia]|uniref:Ribosome hibernation promoting factor n=1 Tax=Almyronema epifaneia S1 TaxID=2991925 RepID=A0ABW6IBK2_9CYAN